MLRWFHGQIQPNQPSMPSGYAKLPYADVVVNVPTSHRHDVFTYSVPRGMKVHPGHLVQVPFGRRKVHGVVVGLTDQLHVNYTKAILGLLHPDPVLAPNQLELAYWVSNYYMAPLFQALAPMLPPGLRTPSQATVQWVQGTTANRALSPAERLLLAYLEGRPGPIRLSTLTRRFGLRAANAARGLSAIGLAEFGWSNTGQLRKARVERNIRLSEKTAIALHWADNQERKAPRRAALVRWLTDFPKDGFSLTRARRLYGASAVAGVLKDGLARIELMNPTPFKGMLHGTQRGETALPPTGAQLIALNEILAAVDSTSSKPRTFLLQGVTGSGKTEIYLQALAHCLSLGKRGIVLVPELSLTPQMVARFEDRFPGRIGVLHSGLTPAQQAEQWWLIHDGDYPIVIGSRSAIFAPQQQLGLIVLDEEHEWTYKQQDTLPRYHSREVANHLAELTGAVVVLGSATPDIVSAYRAKTGRYRLLTLPERVVVQGISSSISPSRATQVEIVDMREELRSGNREIFSTVLRSALEECIDGGHQAILFLNRRGSAGIVQCRRCGFVVRCWRCSNPYTYHNTGNLICHYCNRRRTVPTACPQCRGQHIRYLGVGTQRVVEEVKQLLPHRNVIRWDRDTAKSRQAHQELMDQCVSGRADIIVGTQMIAKGLHVPGVTLVGVVLADIGLHVPDFRATERMFQVLCQVAGRAGRGMEPGRVVIQTFLPDHYAIQMAASQSYENFYTREISFRRTHQYPPLGRLIKLSFGHNDEATARNEAARMAATLKKCAREWGITHVDIIGPAPKYPPRLRGIWHWQIVMRGNNPRMLLDKVVVPPNWTIDVDPVAIA